MWISRTAFVALHEKISDLAVQLAIARTNSDHFRLRVNQLESERAQLLTRLTGVAHAAPQIERHTGESVEDYNGAAIFEDIGDAEARKRGIAHDEHGTVQYGRPLTPGTSLQ